MFPTLIAINESVGWLSATGRHANDFAEGIYAKGTTPIGDVAGECAQASAQPEFPLPDGCVWRAVNYFEGVADGVVQAEPGIEFDIVGGADGVACGWCSNGEDGEGWCPDEGIAI